MSLNPIALELYAFLPHRDMTIREAVPGRADPPAVGRIAEQYAVKRLRRYDGETNPGTVARCAGVLIYAMDGYGLTFEDVCGLADHEVATVVAEVTPDNRMAEPIRHLRLRESVGLASEVAQLVKLAEIAAFARKVLHELLPEEYLRHAQQIKHVVDRHAQLIQAMSRLNARGAPMLALDATREALARVSHAVDEARAARVAARRVARGHDPTPFREVRRRC